MDKEDIYLRLPIAFQNIVCSLQGAQIQSTRYSKDFVKYLQLFEERLFWSRQIFEEYRDQQLIDFVQHCIRTVPYYKQLFLDLGIRESSIKGIDDLMAIPVLTKEMVQQQYGKLLSTSIPHNQQIITHTSGTTGGGLRFATTQESIWKQWATWWRYRRLHGIQLETWCGYFGGRSVVPLPQKYPPFWRYNFPGRQILFSAYHISPDNLEVYINELRRKRPPWLHGYPSLLALLANYIIDRRLDLGYSPKWITIGAENLLSQQVITIEQAFGVRPVQHYGMTEAVANFSECRLGKLHVDEDFAAVEFIPNDDRSGYKVIGTNFTNLATPLLRYEVGDTVELETEGCHCGLPGRIVKNVDGRREDYVILRNGSHLGRMDHIFKDMTSIREAQIYQNTIGVIVVRIVKNALYTSDSEHELLREFYKRVGDQAEIHIEYVDKIERSSTGKLRFVISDVVQGKLV